MLGVILAGGLSTRMGHDKALLRVEGQRVLERNRTLLQAVCGKTLIVARDPQQAATLDLPHARIVTDLVPDCGPLGGIHTAFELVEDDLFVIACDLPLLQQTLIERLVAQFQAHSPRVLFPRTPEGPDGTGWRDQPLCAIWSRACKADVAVGIATGHLSLRRLIATWPNVLRADITPADAPQFRNINTPDDLRSL